MASLNNPKGRRAPARRALIAWCGFALLIGCRNRDVSVDETARTGSPIQRAPEFDKLSSFGEGETNQITALGHVLKAAGKEFLIGVEQVVSRKSDLSEGMPDRTTGEWSPRTGSQPGEDQMELITAWQEGDEQRRDLPSILTFRSPLF